jgi:D-3-phosphoglycerate dehydrogenase
MALSEGSSVDRVEVELLGRIAERETRPLAVEVLLGVLAGHTEEEVNAVNAPSIAEERGIELTETRSTQARDFSDLVRVSVVSGEQRVRVVGTTLGSRHRPHLLEAWGQRFNLQLEQHITLFRYSDVPGMIGRVGTCFGENGINISSAAVGHTPDDGEEGLAVMVVTTDAAVPQAVVDQIVSLDGFVAGRSVALG